MINKFIVEYLTFLTIGSSAIGLICFGAIHLLYVASQAKSKGKCPVDAVGERLVSWLAWLILTTLVSGASLIIFVALLVTGSVKP